MSNFQAIGMIMAIVVANMPIYFVLDRWIQGRSDAIVSGVVRGLPVSIQHRWIILQHSWVPSVAGLIGFEAIVAVGFIMIGRSVDTEEVHEPQLEILGRRSGSERFGGERFSASAVVEWMPCVAAP